MTSRQRRQAQEVYARLLNHYGERLWEPRRDPLGEMVLTVLSQHTSDVNAFRTYESLRRRFPTWDEVAMADPSEVAPAIKSGGLSRIKAPRIIHILQGIQKERGSLDLSFLGQIPLEEARAWLRALPGVGPKTAACVLLFSFGLPALPVDTHVHRVARRLGLVDGKASAERAHEDLESLLAPEQVYQFHVDVITHGRQVCKAPQPRCEACVLNDICPSSTVERKGSRAKATVTAAARTT